MPAMTALSELSFRLPLNIVVRALGGRTRAKPSLAEALPSTLSDSALVAVHLSGDPRGFTELVKRYTTPIYNVAYRFTGSVHDAENLTQETFIRAWNALPRVALDKPLKPYLIKIAVNLCHDWAEQRKIELVPLDTEPEHDLPDPSADPLGQVSTQEMIDRLQARILDLPPLYRTVLTLRYNEELSYEEIAGVLDLPLNTVRTQLRRAKVQLRELLEQAA